MGVYEKFIVAASLKVNKYKSQIIYVNCRTEILERVSWENGHNKWFRRANRRGYLSQDILAKLPKIQGKLPKLKDGELSFIGKVRVLKSEFVALLVVVQLTLTLDYQ